MDLKLLETLKQRLLTAKEFEQVFTYFLDQFGEDPEFIAQGERTDSPFLEAVMGQVGKELFRREIRVTDVLLTRLPEQQFIHCACRLAGRLANVIYFEDVRTGLLVVILSEKAGETKFARFSGRPLHGPRDWGHLNEAGYRLLGSLLAARIDEQPADACEDRRE